MQVTYQLTPDNFYQGYLAWRSQRKWKQWLRWIAYFAVGAVSLMSLWLLLFARSTETNATALVAFAFGTAWFAFMLLFPRFSSRRQFRNNPMAQSAITLAISEQGFEFHNSHVDSKVAWSAYVAWGEAKSVFIVMPQARIYGIVPKRAFGEEQVGEFRETLRRNIAPKS